MASLADLQRFDPGSVPPPPPAPTSQDAGVAPGYRFVAPWQAPDGTMTTVAPEQLADFQAGLPAPRVQAPPVIGPGLGSGASGSAPGQFAAPAPAGAALPAGALASGAGSAAASEAPGPAGIGGPSGAAGTGSTPGTSDGAGWSNPALGAKMAAMQSAVAAATPAGATGAPNAVLGWNNPGLGAKMQAMQAAVDSASTGSQAGSGQTPPQPDGKMHGGIANLGAGTSNAVAGTLGGPVDLVTGALNLIPRGINAATGASLPPIQNPVGGSDWWRSAMGLIGADPRNVAADDFGDRFLRGVGEGVAGTLLPMGIAGQAGRALDAVGAAAPVARGVAQTMAAPSAWGAGAAGAASGAGGAAAEEVVPDDYKPAANMVGQLAGGGFASAAETAAAGLGRAAGNGARAFLGPVSSTSPLARLAARGVGADIAPQVITDAAGNSYVASPTQMGVVQKSLARAAGTTPGTLADSIPSAADAALVPGSQPTLGQVTGNTGVLGLERTLRTANREPFTNAEAANNGARLEALRNLEDPATQAYTAGQYFSRRAAQIDADTDAAITRARHDAAPILDGMGGHGSAAHYGQEIAGYVNAAHAPAVKAARDAEELARGRARQTDEALGGNALGSSDATARQAYSAAVRGKVDEAISGSKSAFKRLYDALDPEGKWAIPSHAAKSQAAKLGEEIDPASGLKMSPAEEHWIGTVKGWGPVVRFKTLSQARQGIGEDLRAAQDAGHAQAARRLTMLRAAIDETQADAIAMHAGVEAPHVTAGHLAPEESMLGRLAGHAGADDADAHMMATFKASVEDWRVRRAEQSAAANSGASPAAGDGATARGRATAIPGASRAAGEGQRGFGGAPGHTGNPSGSEPLEVNFTAQNAAEFAAARKARFDHQQRFAGAPFDVTARASTGREYKVEDSQAAARFWNGGKNAAEDAQSLVRTTGSQEAAEQTIGDYAAHDLRARPGMVKPEGTLDPGKFQAWLANHREALTAFPGLRARFGTALKAAQELGVLSARRADIEAANPVTKIKTDTGVLERYFQAGPKGAEAMQAYMRDTAGQPGAVDTLTDGIASLLRDRAMRDGELNTQAYRGFMTGHAAALDAAPASVRTKFETAAKAQQAVEDAQTAKRTQVKDYQDSAASFYLDKGGNIIDPQNSIKMLLGSSNPTASAADLMRMARPDQAAVAGIRRNTADYILEQARTTAEAGTTQAKQVGKRALDNLVNGAKTAPALAQIFTPEQMTALRNVVADMDREARSINATKIPGSPGTAADLHALSAHGGGHASILSQLAAGELGGEIIGHVASLKPVTKAVLKVAATAASVVANAGRAVGIKHTNDLLTAAVLNPELARLLLVRPVPASRIPIARKAAGVLANLSVDGVTSSRRPAAYAHH